MLIPKKDRLAVYQYLFKEGVLYAKKDFNLAKHPELDVRNLYVIKLLQSLEAKELVKEIYAWRHFYVRTERGDNWSDGFSLHMNGACTSVYTLRV